MFFVPCRRLQTFRPLNLLFRCGILFTTLLVTAGIAPEAHAQITQSTATSSGFITNITSTPDPSSGHSYLRDLSEIVNPANGALSIRIAASRPHERGLNTPLYAFLYNSTDEYQIAMWQADLDCYSSNLNTFQERTTTCINNVVQPQMSNWAQWNGPPTWNAAPNTLTYNTYNYTWYVTNVQIANCQVRSGYVYEDADGVRHPLNITAIWNGQSNGIGGSSTGICNQYFSVQPAPLGGDSEVKFVAYDVDTNNPGVVRAADSAGTSLNVNYFPASPEDSNGNCFNSTGRAGSYLGYLYSGGMCGGTITGLGPSSNTGTYSVTFPGTAAPYTYTKQYTTMTYAVGYRDITPSSDPLCTTNENGNTGNNVYAGATNVPITTTSAAFLSKFTSVGLPDGLSYQFSYDPVYGYINQVTYPTGAWVQYTWGVNTNAEMMGWGPAARLNSNIEPVYMPSGSNMNTSCYFRHDFPVITKRVVSYDGVHPALEQDFSYSTTWPSTTTTQWTTKTTTVTTKDLLRPGSPSFQTIYTYTPGFVTPSMGSHVVTSGVPMESTIVHKDISGNVVRTETKVWSDTTSTAQLVGECETLPGGATSGKFYQYAAYPFATSGINSDITNEAVAQTNELTDVAEYDYGTVSSTCTRPSSTPVRETQTTYASFAATGALPTLTYIQNGSGVSYTPTGLWGKASTVKTYGNGVLMAETDFNYDENAPSAVSAPYDHDDAVYGPGATTPRGNPTTITKKCFNGAQACSNSVVHISYDTTGQPVSVTDANNNQTTLSYADNYTSDDGLPSGNTNTYVTQITRPSVNGVAHQSSYQYDFNKGSLRAATDENSKVTHYYNNDPWNRLTEVDYPDGGVSKNTYTDIGPNPTQSTSTLMQTSGQAQTSTTVMDGVGHVTRTELTSDPSGTDYVDTSYDGLGNKYTVSNPYRSTGDQTYGVTTYTYDSLGRVTGETQPDGTSKQYCVDGIAGEGQTNCTANKSSLSNVSWMDISDEAGNHWQQVRDSFGRLTAVVEPSPSTGAPALETDYTYDALNNILGVNQKGASAETARKRSFSYDSLSRLITSLNPESGLMCYGVWSGGSPGSGTCQNGYDPNGNLLAKTDATGLTINYQFDALNRMTHKWAADVDNMQGWFTYDAGANGIGRLSSENRNAVGGESYSYDSMGRVTGTSWINYAAGNAWQTGMQITYDLTGNPITLIYPDGRALNQTWDASGRLQTITDSTSGGSGEIYFQGSTAALLSGVPSSEYWASGALANAQLGNGVTTTVALDNRLQPCHAAASTPLFGRTSGKGNIFDRQNYFTSPATAPCGNQASNNGNIYAVVDNLAAGMTQSLGYDKLNRLTGGARSDGGYNLTYVYDSFGNMVLQDNIHGSLNYTINPANNQLLLNGNNFLYDAAGRLAQVPNPLGGTHYFTYTGEGYVRCMDGCVQVSYLTDAIGQRTFTGHGTPGWNENVYLNGQTMADIDQTGTWTDYIYANGQKIARVNSADAPLHLSGTVCSNCGGSATYVQLSSGAGRVIQTGDTLYLSQYSVNGSEGGAILLFTDGSATSGLVAQDQNQQQINCDGIKNQWHQRQINLNAYAGKTLASTLLLDDVCSAGGQFDIYFNDVAISGNGTTSTIYSPQMGATFSPADSSSWPGKATNTSAVAQPNNLAPMPGVHFYLADQLGTAEMELSNGGWPVWQGQYTPFGQEILNGTTINAFGPQPSDGTAMRHKFTGKEADQETGLDYFGARYYASLAGRFTIPDWSTTPQAVPYSDPSNPQSFNLYSYVLNNPLSKLDPNGHNWFDVNGLWSWHPGNTWQDGGNTYHSNYTGLLVAQAVGTDAKTGATKYNLTLYDQNKVVGTGSGFSGGNVLYRDAAGNPTGGSVSKSPIASGNYTIRLFHNPEVNSIDPNTGQPPPAYGIQPVPLGPVQGYRVYDAYGPLRAYLRPDSPGGTEGAFFHGQFDNYGYTHGCLTYGTDTRMINYMYNKMDQHGNVGVSVGTSVQKP